MTRNKILIVDDEPDVIAYLSIALEDNDYLVKSATNASAGFQIAQEFMPDIICLDILMPGQTGVSLYEKLRMDKKPLRKEFNFNLGDSKQEQQDDSVHSRAVENIDKIIGSSSSSEEQARRYEEVLNNPPDKDFNKVEVYKAEDEDGNLCCAIVDPENGKATARIDGEDVKVTLINPLIKFDLFDLFEGQLSEASIDVVPHIMDEKVQIEMNERKEYKPEKAKKDLSNYYWVLYLLMFLPMIIIGLLYLGGIW